MRAATTLWNLREKIWTKLNFISCELVLKKKKIKNGHHLNAYDYIIIIVKIRIFEEMQFSIYQKSNQINQNK